MVRGLQEALQLALLQRVALEVAHVAAFAANYVLNMVWSYLFFRRRRPDWAMIEVVPFFLTIVWMMVAVAPLSSTAVLLLVPYLCWVSFATVLNATIIKLNHPFDRP